MSQSLTKIYLHIIFGTKNREKIIDQNTKPELIKYIAGILKKLGCNPVKIGGTSNHRHLLTTFPRTSTLSDIIKTTKIDSSKWIKPCDKTQPTLIFHEREIELISVYTFV